MVSPLVKASEHFYLIDQFQVLGKSIMKDNPGYTFGSEAVPRSFISLHELDQIKTSVGFTEDDECYLRLAGEVLKDQAKQVVAHWRSQIIVSIPHLARHSRSPDGKPLPDYLAASNKRFE